MKKLDVELLEYLRIKKYIINLEKNKYLLYKSIYSLGFIKLETLKTHIMTNIANNFIWLFKFSAKANFFFIKKLDSSF